MHCALFCNPGSISDEKTNKYKNKLMLETLNRHFSMSVEKMLLLGTGLSVKDGGLVGCACLVCLFHRSDSDQTNAAVAPP